jgi:hypothetical protein
MKYILGFFSISILITLIFTVLKLSNVISFAWIWVISPLWIQGIITLLVVVSAILIGGKVESWFKNRSRR